MRVAYICEAPFISGAERSLQVMLDYVFEVDIDPYVIAPFDSAILPWCQNRGIPALICPFALRDKWHPFRWIVSVRAMRALFRDYQIDLIHSNQLYSYPAAGVAGRDLGLPRVCHIRDEIGPGSLEWWCNAGVEAILCISQHIESQAASAWDSQQQRPMIETILNPVRFPDQANPAGEERIRSVARQRLRIPEGAVALGFIGQIAPVKGLCGLIDVLGELRSNPSWHLLISGRDPQPGAPYERECRDLVKRLKLDNRVTFVGFLDDVGPFYRAIDVAVVPSLREPLGRVPLEAASYAKPSIAFAAGGLKEVVRDGETGRLVPVGDWIALAAALSEFIANPESSSGIAARHWAEVVADPRRYVLRIKKLYDIISCSKCFD